MSEKRYMLTDFDGEVEMLEKINEQQATIQRMKHSLNTIYKSFEKHYGYDMRNAVWLIDELSYDEIVDELYIAETDSKNRKESSMYWKKKVDGQQATITNLQGDVERLKYIIEELRKDNYNKFELINKMKKEEKLYAKEILRLNELNKQTSDFTDILGGY